MIISLGNVKGGVGKTTLAVNLAIALSQTQRVLLIDGDEQGTSLLFTKLYRSIGRPGMVSKDIKEPNCVARFSSSPKRRLTTILLST